MSLEPHDEARLLAALGRLETHPSTRAGDPTAIERATGVAMPPSLAELLARVDGGTLKGTGGVLELWSAWRLLALLREDYFAFKSTPRARALFFGSDGGSFEYFFDVDDYYGCGPYAVLVADRASDATELVARSFYLAVERVLDGARRGDADARSRPRPPGSERS